MITRVLLVGLALALSASCGKKDSNSNESSGEQKASEASEASEALPSYSVRGMVKSVSADELMIHHEAIPTFKNAKGEIQPMMSMSMPFSIGKGVATSDLATGDAVEFTFDVDMKRESPSRVTTLKKLPKDTALKISGH